MLDFFRSTFTWKNHPWRPDAYYKYPGGFVGQTGQVYHVRFNLQARIEIRERPESPGAEIFLGSPCRSEYTIARRNLFQIPSGEWRMAFTRDSSVPIAHRPSWETESGRCSSLRQTFQNYWIDLRSFPACTELTATREVVKAALARDLLGACCSYRDAARGLQVTVEFPVNLINLNEDPPEFQVCTGPVIVPDLATWDGSGVHRVFLAHVALSSFEHVEFILRREVQASEADREWLDRPRGRDRLELIDPGHAPAGYPPSRPRLTVYNETWELDARNVFLRADNPLQI
ncbi:MAG: hypothetical protein HYU36_20495 [Planctomycetes bacterium]|nr:hypothetical protein [Planctomycetota bacterium]